MVFDVIVRLIGFYLFITVLLASLECFLVFGQKSSLYLGFFIALGLDPESLRIPSIEVNIDGLKKSFQEENLETELQQYVLEICQLFNQEVNSLTVKGIFLKALLWFPITILVIAT